MTAIDCKDAHIALGGRMVLRNLDLNIDDTEFIGVLGANGAGKTTLLRAILGLVPVKSGRLQIFGRAPQRGNPAIGYMPQIRSGPAFGRLRARDVLLAIASGRRWGIPWPDAATGREVDHALDLVGAASLADRPLDRLSGGERQRLLLAQALIGNPGLLLLDEPLISLDPNHQDTIVTLVRQFQRDLKITVLFCAHELNPLLGALDRVLYLGGGHAALGSVDEVIRPDVLSRLYGAPIEVLRHKGRIFVMSGSGDLGHCDHDHVSERDPIRFGRT